CFARHQPHSPAGKPGQERLPERTVEGVQALLVADPIAIGRIDDDEAGRLVWRDEFTDGELPKVGHLGDAGALSIGTAHGDRPCVSVTPVESDGGFRAGSGTAHTLPGSLIERREL